MSNIGGKRTRRKFPQKESGVYGVDPTWNVFLDVVKERYYHVDDYEYQYINGPHCKKRRSNQCHNSQILSIPCTPSWVSKTLSDIWF
jgi:hypothetical protein